HMTLKTKTLLLLIVLASFIASLAVARPAAAASAQASFIRTDTTTQGNWKGVYGLDGYIIPATTTNKVPGYAALTPENDAEWTWTSNGTETRDLQASSTSLRQASCWYTSA